MSFYTVLLYFLVLVYSVQSIKWLALSQASAIASTSRDPGVCDQMKGSLIKKQVKFCKRNPGFMDSVRLGAVRAIDECQYQFRARRWNCSTLQENYNKQVNFIKAQLGSKMTGTDMTGGMSIQGFPSLSTSSVYSRGALAAPTYAKPFNQEPTMNAMVNSYSAYRYNKREGRERNSRNIRGGRNRGRRKGRSRSSKSRRNTEEVLPIQLQTSTNELGNMTITEKASNNDLKKREKQTEKKRKVSEIDKWNAALGPYPVVSPGTKEASFVHAISSAGVAHAVTRSCSSGELENCGCDRSLRGMSPEGFQWSGCSDNVDFGVTFSRTFVDAQDRRKSRKNPKSPVSLMNLHNNEAGRKLLEKNMKVECKCHGVSGSCELKTCWRSLASFRMIGAMLKEKFDGAREVKQKRKNGRRMLLPKDHRFKPHSDTDLVYLVNSPDYCELDVKRGSLGTKGRECDPSSKGIDGCDLLCCSRGYTTRRERRVERCKCKFHWCCYVECEECVRELQISTCN
ncbi:protein Wnt-4 [Eurytemora carolleeae]|uniref:protein Wnt-4 n=1 Tax=Eurytemora carolleeae TaxID=1294199 RepID=UPI000C789393|nr:protein Wnt-4 [Eurytemora carolleeae]|eukprot:XP_023320891.1 protein Wnt-4-like [Eurytemora affinis]